MSKQKTKISPILHQFVDNLRISDKDDAILKDARKKVREHLRAGFRQEFPEYLKNLNVAAAAIEVAVQLSDERVKFLTQGSFQYNTLNKPQHTPPQQMDLDDGIYFIMSDIDDRMKLNPKILFDYVEQKLKDLFAEEGWLPEKKPTCVRAKISEDKHMDMPIYAVPAHEFNKIAAAAAATDRIAASYILDENSIWMAHRELSWIKSDPRKIEKWVKDCSEEYGPNYKKISRIMKAWRDHQWLSSPLSSICIMQMVNMALENCISPKDDLDTVLFDVVRDMHFIASTDKSIQDPVDREKSLSESIDPNRWKEIENRLKVLVDALHDVLYGDGNKAGKIQKLMEQFGRFFPNDTAKISITAAVVASVSTAPTTVKAARPYYSGKE